MDSVRSKQLHRPASSSAVVTGPTALDQQIEIVVELRRRLDHEPLPDLSVWQPRKRLSNEEFAARYGASDEDVDAVLQHFRAAGLTPGYVCKASRRIDLTGSVAAVNAVFNIELLDYEKQDPDRGLTQFRAHELPPEIPGHLEPLLVGIHRLSTERQRVRHLLTINPVPGVNFPAVHTPITAATQTSIYEFPANYSATGQIIAIAVEQSLGKHNASDLSLTCQNYGVSVPTFLPDVQVSASPVTSVVSAEATLDVSMVALFAPGAQIVNYIFDDLDAMAARIANPHAGEPHVNVVSISFGSSDTLNVSADGTQILIPGTGFLDCAMQGITVCVASGDTGPIDNLSPPHYGTLWPASSPWALAVGGTSIGAASGTISSSNYQEWLWGGPNTFNASGGGISTTYNRPDYQTNANLPARGSQAPAGFLKGAAGRGVPDIASAADGSVNVYWTGVLMPLGGTSQAAPTMASMIACLNKSLGFNLGFLNSLLYTHNGSSTLFHPMDTGSYPDNSVVANSLAYFGYPIEKLAYSASVGLGRVRATGLLNVATVSQAVSDITLSNPLMLGAQSAGAVVSNIIVSLSTGGTFAGTLAITGGLDAAKFAISGSNLTLAVALDNTAWRNLNVSITATPTSGTALAKALVVQQAISPINWAGPTTSPFTTSPGIQIIGLTQGASYTFEVQVSNSSGQGAVSAPIVATTTSSSSSFTISKGNILSPSGSVFTPKGFALLDSMMSSVSATTIKTTFPSCTFINLAVGADGSGYASAQPDPAIFNWVDDATTNHGLVVMLSDYQPGQPPVRTGTDLTNAMAWYTRMATHYANNPNVWWTTENETFDASGQPGSLTAYHVACYNAIRNAKNNGLIFMEAAFGAQHAPGFQLTSTTYSNMTGVGFNIHTYVGAGGGSFPNGADYDVTQTTQSYYDGVTQGFVSGWSSFATSKDGTMPVLMGEGGNSTTGNNPSSGKTDDPKVGNPAVFAVTQSIFNSTGSGTNKFKGWAIWLWNWQGGPSNPSDADCLVLASNGTLTDYGTQTKNNM